MCWISALFERACCLFLVKERYYVVFAARWRDTLSSFREAWATHTVALFVERFGFFI